MKIHFLGTCSGTEPFAGTHQCSLVVEVNGSNYWFDCGEGCAHTAYTKGLDVLKNRVIFISHLHGDHMCGMPHLFLVMQKLTKMYNKPLLHNNTLEIFMPCLKTLEAVKTVCNSYTYKDQRRFEIIGHKTKEGLLYEDENIRVSALSNGHLKDSEAEDYKSYSFLIEAENKRVVFSGDIKSSSELDPFVAGGCDMLIHETGHHKVANVCEYAVANNVRSLVFNHHGREILNDRQGCQKIVEEYSKKSNIPITILSDGDTHIL